MDINLMDSVHTESPSEASMGDREAVLAMAQSDQTQSDNGSNTYRAIVKWSLMISAFLVPLLFLPWTTSVLELNKSLLVLIVAGTGLIAWLLSLVSSGRFTWRPNAFDKGVLAILGATFVATIFSVARFNSLFGTANNIASSLMMVFAFSIIYFLVVNSSEKEGLKITDILTTSLSFVLLFGFLQIVGVHIFKFLGISALEFTNSNAFNSVGPVNSLGVIAAVALPLFSRNQSNKILKYLNILGLILGLAILVVLNWWTLWTIAIVGMVGWIIFESITHERFSISRFIIPMTVIVVGVFLMIVNFNLKVVKSNLPVEIAPSFSLSRQVAESTLKESSVTGYGPTTFSIAFDKYGASELSDSTFSGTRFSAGMSEIFNAVTTGGAVMILALLIVLWGFVQGVIRYVKNKRIINTADTQYIWATLSALGAAFLLYPFNMTLMFLAYLVLALAALSLWGNSTKVYDAEQSTTISLASSLGFITGLILVLVGAYFGASAYIADVQYAKAITQENIDNVSAGLVSAVNWNDQSYVYYQTASQVALVLLDQELKKPNDSSDTQRSARVNNYMASSINLAKKATELGPRESVNWANLGNVYRNLLGLVAGVDSLSASAYEKAAELRPGDPSFHNEIGSLYLAEYQLLRQTAAGSKDAAQLNKQAVDALSLAETNFKKATDLSTNFGIAIYNLGIVYDQQGKLPDAIKQLEKVAPFNNDKPGLLFELGLLYYRNGDKDKAFDAFQKVLVLQPDFANANWYLALILEERGDFPNAITQLNKILSVEANKDNQTVLDKIAQLGAGQMAANKGIDEKPL